VLQLDRYLRYLWWQIIRRWQNIRWRGLRTRIITWSFVPTALILFAVAWATFSAYQQVTQDLVMERNQELARLSAGQLERSLGEYSALLESVARTADMTTMQPATQSAGLSSAAGRLSVFDGGIVILDHFGAVDATYPARVDIYGQDWSKRDYFRAVVRSSAPAFSDVVNDGPDGTPVVVMAVPILGTQGEMLGVLAGLFRIDRAANSAFYGSILKLRIGVSSMYLVDSAGKVIFHTDAERIGIDASGEQVVRQVVAGQVGNLRTVDLNGQPSLAGFAPVPATPWGLVTEETWSSLMASGARYRTLLLFLLSLGLLVPVLVMMWGMGQITQPIKELTTAAEEVAGGLFEQQININTGDELQELAEQFNVMAAQLRESYANLEQRVADRTRALGALNAIAGVVNQSLDVDEVLSGALEKICEVTGMDGGGAFSHEDAGVPSDDPNYRRRSLVLKAHMGISEEVVEVTQTLPLEGTLAGQTVGERRPIARLLVDYPENALRAVFLAEGIQQMVSIPLVSKGELLGVIGLVAHNPRLFDDEDLALLMSMGRQVGVAMENARLYEKAEEVAAAAERSRLARDLHDAVTQTLFSASLIAEVLPRLWERNPDEGQRRLGELRQLTRGALAEMRTLLLELRPAVLTEIPLGDLLRQLGESTTGRARVPVTLSMEGQVRPLPADVQVVFYRIAQEALNNVIKHSGASAAIVSLHFEDCPDDGHDGAVSRFNVELSVADNGNGFIVHGVGADHLGLRIMRERAESVGALLDVDSAPDEGTEITVTWEQPADRH
jgi:nitrate/nitrite-specific signal transduction histidine kinase